LFKVLKRYFFEHASLIFVILGACSLFACNILMKEILSPALYGQFSVFITYCSLIYVFGMFGLEQVFLRFSKACNNTIKTQKTQFLLIIPVILLLPTITTILFKKYYSEIIIDTGLLFYCSLGLVGSMFLFTVFRLNSNFVLSQIMSNGWKIGMFILSILYFLFHKSDFNFFITTVAIIIIIIFLIFLFYALKSINIQFNDEVSNRDLIESSLHFFISIASFSLLIFCDRIIVEHKYNFVVFGNFFYLCNFFLAPFSILQNYIGFKQLIFFKSKFNKNYLVSFSKKIILLGTGLALSLFFIAVFLNYFKLLNFQFDTYNVVILLLLFTGVVRLYSSSIGAAFEAKTSITTLRRSNFLITFITILILTITFFFVDSIEIILFNIIILWVLRSVIHKKLLLHQIKEYQ